MKEKETGTTTKKGDNRRIREKKDFLTFKKSFKLLGNILKCKGKRNERKNKNQRNRMKEKKIKKKGYEGTDKFTFVEGGGFVFDSKIYLEF